MQFLHLFSFVVVASYAAALPQPAGLSEQYSNNIDVDLASGLEARSYQPGSNFHKDSATLVSLKRRGNRGSGSSLSYVSAPQNLVFETNTPFGKAQFSARLLSSVIKEFGNGLGDAPENVKAAGAAVSGDTGDLLVQYVQRSLQAADSLNDWVKGAEQNLFTAIKSGLGDEEYFKVKPLLDDASKKLTADASDNRQQVTVALFNITRTFDLVKLEIDAVQAAFGRVFEDYEFYIKTLQPHLNKFASGQDINKYLSDGVESLVKFSLKQERLYFTVRNGIQDAPYN
ncbi:hypothetical protein BASA50_006712 [Batrachochytrium salamandrivorans]|uniref:Uncharacterized protein n=1 Tax=Batrachochytrium salamandrivorans TaxID=1357716 RepID=A0ABQ8F9F7_9FUNG|nr:hypothetical protein BASA62_008655 [Batrachochytrium salamandrivorans]KAH6579437.1 hypothetical protein BASA60_003287 [Batrachochytrium salamandrivorans]KAH6580204.1 hypothetical protein BASA61_009808 [Batrachochytrium salamandrivorans]KAH6594465.1 hypothetical protein BASA50_006712 [Batrachochytrium salamandrivorans]KAH9253248.1 hypothetical protein BASA81_008759 [Batrachochytrium salamandrivorans]